MFKEDSLKNKLQGKNILLNHKEDNLQDTQFNNPSNNLSQ